ILLSSKVVAPHFRPILPLKLNAFPHFDDLYQRVNNHANGVTAATPSDTFPLEEALSHDSQYMYVLESRLLLTPPGAATLGGFQIHANGSLTSVVDPAAITLPLSAIGLAAE